MVETKITRMGGKSGDSAHSEGNGGQSSTNLQNQQRFIDLMNELTRTRDQTVYNGGAIRT